MAARPAQRTKMWPRTLMILGGGGDILRVRKCVFLPTIPYPSRGTGPEPKLVKYEKSPETSFPKRQSSSLVTQRNKATLCSTGTQCHQNNPHNSGTQRSSPVQRAEVRPSPWVLSRAGPRLPHTSPDRESRMPYHTWIQRQTNWTRPRPVCTAAPRLPESYLPVLRLSAAGLLSA